MKLQLQLTESHRIITPITAQTTQKKELLVAN